MRMKRIWIPLAVLCVAGALLGTDSLQADAASQQSGQRLDNERHWNHTEPSRSGGVTNVEWIGVTGACAQSSDGVNVFRFGLQKLAGSQWAPLMDDGKVKLQVHGINGRYGPTGAWGTFSIGDGFLASGGEGALRFEASKLNGQGTSFDKFRLVHGAFTSTEIAATLDPCD